jgi:hypothetical protein
MFQKCLRKTTRLVAYIRWFNIVEDWQHQLPHRSSALHDLHKFLQAPPGLRVVPRENNDRDFGPLDCRQEFGCEIFSSSELVVVSEGVDSGIFESEVEVVGEVLACVFASETQEDVVGPAGMRGRRRRRREEGTGSHGQRRVGEKWKMAKDAAFTMQGQLPNALFMPILGVDISDPTCTREQLGSFCLFLSSLLSFFFFFFIFYFYKCVRSKTSSSSFCLFVFHGLC